MGEALHRPRGRPGPPACFGRPGAGSPAWRHSAVRPRAAVRRAPLALLAAALLAALLLPASAARADYRNPRLAGELYWLPPVARPPDTLVSLAPTSSGGRLRVPDNVVREAVSVDPDRGILRVEQLVGDAPVAPAWVEDLPEAARAQGRVAAARSWRDAIRKKATERDAKRATDVVSIELPVDFPDAVARAIGQGARLNLSGSERITFSGTSTILQGGPQFESGNPSIFPDLDIKQQLRLNLDGTIGEKIHVLVNHDSEVSTSFDNKIQLRYDGDEDEVIQKVEMGNTDLSLPGSEFLSFRKSQQGLFGAKAIAKLGALDFTAIASKQEGQVASQTFVGQARRDSVIIRDWEFVKRTYYWVAPPLQLAQNPGGDGAGVLPVRQVDVFLDDKDPRNDIVDLARIGFAYVDPATGTQSDSIAVVRGTYHRLTENQDYRFDRATGVLTLERSVAREHTLAIQYTRDDGQVVGVVADTLSLQLLAPPERDLYDDAKGFRPLRLLEQKNVYSIGARNINPDSFEMVIRKRASSAGIQDDDAQQDPVDPSRNLEYVRLLGLDYKGLSTADPDLRVEPEFVDFEDGTVTFPNLTPFAPDSSVFGGIPVNVIVDPSLVPTGRSSDPVPLLEYNSGLYELEPDDLINREKYLLAVQFTTPTPSYNLNRFNILEGSETVRLDGRTLQRGADYDIDYDLGILTFRTADANKPDARIEVDFQYVPLFGQAKESLVGMSGTYNFADRTRLSSSWLFYSRSTPEQRPKLGQEPSRIVVGNVYGQWAANPGLLTDLVNAIPLVRSEDESEVQIQGEAAVSLPNPNTKNEIYIDDMEGVEDSRELPLTRGLWVPASEPSGPGPTIAHPDLDKATLQIRPHPFNWYNPENAVRRRDVFVELSDEQQGQDFLQVLELRTRVGAPDSAGWFGVMRNLSTVGEDFSEKKFLEVWINDFGRNEGTLVVDLGEISEDFHVRSNGNPDLPNKGRGFLDTEDFNPYDGELTVSAEDFGLDNVRGADGAAVAFDDGDDDFRFNRSDPESTRYEDINNYEGNSLLDTEDLDGDNLLDTDDVYASYVMDLTDTVVDENGYLVQTNFDPVARPGNHWRLFRIPLDAGEAVGGVPRRRSVKYVRLWFDGVAGTAGAKFQVASVEVKGASWLEEKQTINATGNPVEPEAAVGTFVVSTADNKENLFYFPPFDPGEDTNNEQRREQALVMEYDMIPSAGDVARPGEGGRQGTAYREILDTGNGANQDFTQYESMSLYFRDGVWDRGGNVRDRYQGDVDLVDGSTGTFFLRFGPDTTNFYEFSTTRLPGQGNDPGWREAFIELNRLAELKLDPPQRQVMVEGVSVDYRSTVVDGDTLAVYGQPSLSRVRRLTLGVKGDDPALTAIQGEIWVDEIRLRSVLKDPGWASRVSGSARLADFATVDAGARKVDSEFRRIEGTRSGTNETSWNVRGDVKLNKFFDGRGISLPVTAEYASTEQTPRLFPNSDIVLVDPEDKAAARTTTRRNSISSRFAKTRPSQKGWLRYTLDNFTLSVSDSDNRTTSPFVITRADATTGQATYNLNPGAGRTLRLLKRFDLSYFPTVRLGMNGALNVSRSSDVETEVDGTRTVNPRAAVRTRTLDGTLALQWDPLRSNTFDSSFRFNKKQDLDLRENTSLFDSFKRGGRELNRDQGFRASWRPAIRNFLRPVMSYDTNYVEDRSPTVQPPDLASRADSLGGPIRVLRVQNTATRDISAALNLRSLFGSPAPGRQPRRPHSGGDEGGGDRGRGESPDTPPDGEREPEDDGRSVWQELRGGAARVFGAVNDIRGSYTDRRSSRYSRVRDRPDLAYQFGLGRFDLGLIEPVAGTTSNLIEDNTDVSWSSKLDTSVQPLSGIVADLGWTRTTARSILSGSRSKTDDVTWPDVSLALDGLERRGPLVKWAKTSSLNSAFRKNTRRNGRLPPLDEPLAPGVPWYDTESVRREWAPFLSWSTAWQSGLNTTISHNRSTTTEESEFNQVVSRSETESRAYRVTGRYNFQAAKGIWFLGKRLRFKSDLTLNVDIDRSEDLTRELELRPNGTSTSTVRSHRKAFSVKPRATYNFSRKVQGSMDVSYSKSKDIRLDRSETIVGVAFEALIKF